MVNVRWLHAAGHAGSINKKVIEMATELQPTVIDWSEMYWNTDDLREFGWDYNHFIGPEVRRDVRRRPVGHDVVISVRKDAKIIYRESFFLSRAIASNIKYMPERHGKALIFEIEGHRVLIVVWHPHANPFRRVGLVLPVYRRSMRRASQIQRRLEREYKPDLVLNGGDLQLGAGDKWVYPNQMAKRLGMRFRRHGIDWQMWKGQGFKPLLHYAVSPKKANPKMDHPWTVLDLNKETDT